MTKYEIYSLFTHFHHWNGYYFWNVDIFFLLLFASYVLKHAIKHCLSIIFRVVCELFHLIWHSTIVIEWFFHFFFCDLSSCLQWFSVEIFSNHKLHTHYWGVYAFEMLISFILFTCCHSKKDITFHLWHLWCRVWKSITLF